MNKIVKSFTEDPSFVMLKDAGNYYIFKDNKKIFVGCVNDKKPYLKFVSYEDNGKEFWELFLTEDETIPPVNMEKFY